MNKKICVIINNDDLSDYDVRMKIVKIMNNIPMQKLNTHSIETGSYPEWSKRHENLIRREMNQMSTEALSRRKSQIYDSIVAHVNKYGFAPTVRGDWRIGW